MKVLKTHGGIINSSSSLLPIAVVCLGIVRCDICLILCLIQVKLRISTERVPVIKIFDKVRALHFILDVVREKLYNFSESV